MRTFFISITLLISLFGYSQTQYPLGENDFTIEKEHSTIFTTYNGQNYQLKDSVDLSYLMPPAGNQGTKGSCWAWATTYALRSTMDNNATFISSGNLDLTKVYSPEYVYQYYKGNINDCNWGATSSEMLAKILNDGAVKFSDFAYNENACNNQPSVALQNTAKKFSKLGYKVQVLNDLFSIKKILSDNQPLVISIRVDDYFCTQGNITRQSPFWSNYNTRFGSHAMVIVGYNNRLKALKVLNSWGPTFGDNGYVWISYSIINSAMNYCCYPKKELVTLPLTSKSNEETSFDASITADLNSTTTWFKEGYYRPFEKLKIVLAKLSTSKQFAVIEIRDDDYNLKTNFYIDLKSSKEFFIDDKKYKFTFNNIGRAGKNPFNKAVYFTIAIVD